MSGDGIDTLEDLEAAPDPLVGQVLAERYRIVRPLGSGGMGSVYEALHTIIGRRVAVKVLHRQYAKDAGAVRRFLNEARAAGQLGHANILECTDMGRAPDGSPFLVLEFLEGRDLDRELEEIGRLPIARSVVIAQQIASALAAAHARGIVHRDLKPHNVFLVTRGASDHVKVLDFGISKFADGALTGAATESGAIMGTPCYMAPEQMVDAKAADGRADIYALGTVLFHMLTGQLPFDSDTLPNLINMVMTQPVPPLRSVRPEVPEELAALVEQCMSKQPGDRPADMQEVAARLEPFRDVADGPPVPTVPSSRRSLELAETTDSSALQAARAVSVVPTSSAIRSRKPLVVVALGVLVVAGAAIAALRTPDASTPAAVAAAGATPPAMPSPPPPAPLPHAPEPVAAPPSAPATAELAVSAAAPGARVVVRGESHLAPFQASLSAGSARESVEVTAPGRQGIRFWLTLDRDRRLTVSLPRGRGMREATESELSVALGDEVVPAPTGGEVRSRTAPHPSSATAHVSAATASAGPAGPAVTETPAPAPAPVTAPVTAPATHPHANPAPPHPAPGPAGVYRGPQGDVPDQI